MRVRALALGFFVLAAGAVSRADDKPLERAELDRRVVNAVYRAAVDGTEMWNKSANYEGCFRLYQGTLSAVIPLLDHRPKLAATAREKFDKAKSMKAIEGATLLREALDEIQHEIAPGSKVDPKVDPKPDPKPEPMKTLWDRLGGEAGVKKIVDDLLSVAIEDKDVNLLRGKKLDLQGVSRLKQMLVAFISEGTGGTIKYTGKDMKSAHAGMKITEKEFDALAAILLEVLKKNKVAQPDIDDLMKAVGATKKDIVEGKGN
jgi:hemoglobin